MADRSATAERAVPVAWSLLLLMSFLQRPGETSFDTKFDLTADPGRFLERTLHLWNPSLSFGELQNQAYGYLFPQGSYFLLAQVVGIPDWVAQRIWSGLILVVAFEGARRLYRAVAATEDDPATRSDGWAAILAGLAFALSPRLLGLVGVLSAEILPTAVLPWVVLPLVLALRGHLSPRMGGLLSGAAVLGMGGVNAVEDLAALPLAALLLFSARRAPHARRLTGWWVVATSLACVWWFLPLLFLGAYSPPFLDYIETAATTTDPLGWANVARGADHWVGFVQVGGRPWWPAAYQLSTEPWLIIVTSVVAAVSLTGLFHPRMPARRPLALSALLGMALLVVAHAGPLASPIAVPIQELLNGVLAPLRNVHKVDPLVRLPLALGLGHAGQLLIRSLTGRARGASRTARLVRATAATGLMTLILLASAQPMLTGDLRRPGWSHVPGAWYSAVDYLASHAHGRRALVLPGSGFGQQTWGWTIDEPIQGVATTPWVARSQVPLVPGQTIRFLDSLQDRVQDGRGSPSLADALARSGISHVVVRRDLDLFASEAPSPARVDQALAHSPGLTRVASFGDGAIDVLRVERRVARVDAVLEEDVTTLAGGPDDLMSMLEAGALAADRPALVGPGPRTTTKKPVELVGDGYRRRERQFGRLQDSLSQLMTPVERYRIVRAVHDYPGAPGVPRAYAAYPAITSLVASSSSGYADVLGPVRPELGPYSAVDGVPETFWRSAPLERPRGQWLEMRLHDRQPVSHLDVTMVVDPISGTPVRRVRVDVDGHASEHTVDPVSGAVRVPLSGLPVRRIRVTITGVQGDPRYGVVGIREIAVPGLPLGRSVVVPSAGPGTAAFVFRAQPHRRACLRGTGPLVCEPDAARPSEEESGMYRTFTTESRGTWAIRGQVVARADLRNQSLLHPVGGDVAVSATSVLEGDPAVAGQFAFDGDVLTPWLSQRGDRAPALELTWKQPRVLSRIQVRASLLPSRAPVVAELRAGGQTRRVQLGSDQLGTFRPLRTNHVRISFPMPKAAGSAARLPVGVGELLIDGLRGLAYSPGPSGPTGALCGLGPHLTIDGQQFPTRVRGSVADVLAGTPLALEPCGDERLTLPAGQHVLALPSTAGFAPMSLSLAPQVHRPPPRSRDTTIESWGPAHRSVRVGPGAAAVLRVPENVNKGWHGVLHGKPLEKITVDGWQQGYRLPPGQGGVVRLTFEPDAAYRASLAAGGVAALLLLVLTGAVGWRERGRGPRCAPGGWSTIEMPELRRAYRVSRAGCAAAGALAWLLGGPAVAAGLLVSWLLASRSKIGGVRTTAAGALLVALAGLVAALSAALSAASEPVIHGAYADALAGLGVGLLASSLAGTAAAGRARTGRADA